MPSSPGAVILRTGTNTALDDGIAPDKDRTRHEFHYFGDPTRPPNRQLLLQPTHSKPKTNTLKIEREILLRSTEHLSEQGKSAYQYSRLRTRSAALLVPVLNTT
jgi:hypothetical protein